MFNKSISSKYSLKINDILLSDFDGGYIRKISNITDLGDGKIKIETQDVSICEAIQQADISFSFTPNEISSSNIKILDKGVSINPSSLKGLGNLNLKVIFYDDDGNFNTTADQVKLEGTLGMKTKINVFEFKIYNYQLSKLKIDYTISKENSLLLTCNYPILKKDFEKNLFDIPLGNIPIPALPGIVLTPTLEVAAGINLDYYGAFTTGMSDQIDYTTGFLYENSQWSTWKTVTNNFVLTPPTISANTQAQVYIKPKFLIKINHIISPKLNSKIYAEARASTGTTPWWSIYGGLELGFGVEMKLLQKTLIDWNLNVYNYQLLLGQAPVGSAPVANFTASSTSTTVGQPIQFTDQSTNTPTSWLWNFGDGTTSTTQSPQKTYSSAGTYTVSLKATNSYGNNTKTNANYIIITAIGSAPVANFTVSSTSTNVGQPIQFTDQSTNTPTSWLWDFGDGTTSTTQNPSKTYSTAGTYTVSLKATNNYGNNTKTNTNYITVTAAGVAPVANFTASSTSVTVGQSVQFTDQSTNTPTSWLWDFGDGTTSTTQSPSKTYSTAGTYTVSLKATNSYGNNTKTNTNYITVTGGDVGTVTDNDGNVYHTVTIGTQVWMVENLKTTKYRNGDPITPVVSVSAWDALTTGGYCWYDFDATTNKVYGALYNWYAVNDSRNIAPTGWHVPSDDEFKTLEKTLGMTQAQADNFNWRGTDQGRQLKNTSGWSYNGNGTNNKRVYCPSRWLL